MTCISRKVLLPREGRLRGRPVYDSREPARFKQRLVGIEPPPLRLGPVKLIGWRKFAAEIGVPPRTFQAMMAAARRAYQAEEAA